MTSSISAQVRRILTGHSDRAFIHAVDDAGLEYKIEVPIEAVRGVSLDQEHVLVLSWSLQATRQSAAASAESRPNTTPTAVDQAFMELMAGRHNAAPITTSGVTSPSPGNSARAASQGLAEVFGVKLSNDSRHT